MMPGGILLMHGSFISCTVFDLLDPLLWAKRLKLNKINTTVAIKVREYRLDISVVGEW